MNLDLSPKFATTLVEGEGGSYHVWSSSESAVLADTKVGAGKLVLQPRGYALPHYADSSKLGYVLQGAGGLVGVVQPNSSKEVVLRLEKGDVLPVPVGSVSWWYNDGDSDFVMVFLGETSKAYVPGEFTYFVLSGGFSYIAGFSPEFIRRAYNLKNAEEASSFAKSQAGILIMKLQGEGQKLPSPDRHHHKQKMVYKIDSASPDAVVIKGGTFKSVTADKFGFLDEAGLSFIHLELEPNAMLSPRFTTDGSVQVFYVVKGSGSVEIVGIGGKPALDGKVETGQLLVVPRFFVLATVAGNEGLELVSIITSARPMVEDLAGKKSVWNAFSSLSTQVALGLSPESEEVFSSNIEKSNILIPPPL